SSLSLDNNDDASNLDIWNTLLNSSKFSDSLQDRHSSVRGSNCNFLANISVTTFEQLEFKKRLMCLNLSFSLIFTQIQSVRDDSASTLGTFILFPSARCDPTFIIDLIKALSQVFPFI